jgi:hypothetical protein
MVTVGCSAAILSPARQALPQMIEENRGYTASGENPSSKGQTEGKLALNKKKRMMSPRNRCSGRGIRGNLLVRASGNHRDAGPMYN